MTSDSTDSASAASTRRRWRTVLAGVAAVGCALAAPAGASAVMSPIHDPFYKAPEDLASRAPGEVIRSRTTSIQSLPGLKLPFKTYQVAYRTTNRQEKPIVTVATIITPLKRSPQNKRLVSYQTAYDGLNASCQPSYTLQTGRVALQGAETVLMMSLLNRGWTVVTADYEGPDNEWGIGKTMGRGVLDGIRAAKNFEPAGLTDGAATKVGMLGYSGGGQSTAWANELAPSYAPELNIVGAAQGGVGADLEVVQKALDGELYSGIGLAGIAGLVKGYPEVNLDDYLNADGRKTYRMLRGKLACISDFAVAYPFQRLRNLLKPEHRGLLTTPKFQAMAHENSLGQGAPTAPVLWYHTYFDEMGSWSANREVARKYCAAGTPLQFQTSYIEEHAMQAWRKPWKAQEWLSLRFNGAPLQSNCASFT